MSRKNLHVVPKDGKWSVRRTGSSRSSGIYNTQREAVEKAMQIAETNMWNCTSMAVMDQGAQFIREILILPVRNCPSFLSRMCLRQLPRRL